jgi:hypothetical protein
LLAEEEVVELFMEAVEEPEVIELHFQEEQNYQYHLVQFQ